MKRSELQAKKAETLDDLLQEGDQITLSTTEHFIPLRYHGFDVGPIAVSTVIRSGETARQAKERISKALEIMVKEEFEQRLLSYLERVREALQSGKDSGLRIQ